MAGDFSFTANQTGAEWLSILAVAQNPQTLRDALTAASHEMIREFSAYPARAHISRAAVYGAAFASDKQRRWFFASLNDGSLTLPYRRSLTLGRSWAYVVESSVRAVIGTNVPYARTVKGTEDQSQFMAALGWTTISSDAKRAEPKVKAALDGVIRRALGIR